MVGNPIPDSSAAAGSANEVKFHGAGAILNSRLVHTGWKFPSFVLTERDERWLFDVEVRHCYTCCLYCIYIIVFDTYNCFML